MKNFDVKPILIFVVSITIIVNALLIILKHSDAKEEIKAVENAEVIHVINEEHNIKVDNITVKKIDSVNYLVFDVVRLDSNLEKANFILKLLYDGDEVFRTAVVVDSFANKDYINRKAQLPKLKYKFNQLTVDLEFSDSNVVEE